MHPRRLFYRKILYILGIVAGYVFVVQGAFTEIEEAYSGLAVLITLFVIVVTVASLWAIWYVVKSEKL